MFRNPPSFRRFAGSTLLIQSLAWSSMADTIVLKTGERLEAKITSTTDSTVEAEVKMSASITDIRVIQKADIATIEKPDPSEEAFAAVKAAGPGPNSRTAAEYDSAIYSQLTGFTNKYAGSPRAEQAREMIEALKKERERVAAGEKKIENTWYTPVELEKQKDQVNATLLFQQMKSLAQTGDVSGALNVFAKLEKGYPGARSYPPAVDYAVQLLPSVQSEINSKKSIFANEMIERKKGLEVLPDFRKGPLVAAAAAEEAQANAALDAAIKSGTKWTSIYPRNQKSIDELQKTLTAESTRLASIKTAPMHASIAGVDETVKLITAGDFNGATAALQKASTLWPTNALLKDVTAELTLAKATPVPTPAATPILNATPKPAAAPAVSATPTPAPPAPKTAVSPATSAAPAPSVARSAQPPAASEEEPAFFATIPGAVTILGVAALVAGGISMAAKARAKKNASATV